MSNAKLIDLIEDCGFCPLGVVNAGVMGTTEVGYDKDTPATPDAVERKVSDRTFRDVINNWDSGNRANMSRSINLVRGNSKLKTAFEKGLKVLKQVNDSEKENVNYGFNLGDDFV